LFCFPFGLGAVVLSAIVAPVVSLAVDVTSILNFWVLLMVVMFVVLP
jgi:hypothetical protein